MLGCPVPQLRCGPVQKGLRPRVTLGPSKVEGLASRRGGPGRTMDPPDADPCRRATYGRVVRYLKSGISVATLRRQPWVGPLGEGRPAGVEEEN